MCYSDILFCFSLLSITPGALSRNPQADVDSRSASFILIALKTENSILILFYPLRSLQTDNTLNETSDELFPYDIRHNLLLYVSVK